MAQWEERDTLINVVELVAVVASLSHLAPVLRGKLVIIFVDTESVEGTLILGSSHMEDIADLVTLFWELVVVNDIGVYVARMPTDSNPSDGPSRNESEDLEAHGAVGEDARVNPFILDRTSWAAELQSKTKAAHSKRSRDGGSPSAAANGIKTGLEAGTLRKNA